jgi:dipeptidase
MSGGGPIEDVIVDSPYSIPEVPYTYGYFKGVFGHMNDHQLGISESTRGADRALNNPNGIFCVTELSMIAMERCQTARDAIKVMGRLAEQYGFHGFSTGEMLYVADPAEVWIWEIYRPGPLWNPDPATGMDPTGRLGCAWVAQRIPDDEICVMPNLPRIAEINLDDPDNFMASANIFSLADELGLHQSGEPYDMRKMYGRNMRASVRLWNLYRMLAPSQYGNMPYSNDLEDYPFSFKPDKKLTVLDVAELFRNEAEGTEFDNTAGAAAGPYGNPQHYNATRLAATPSSEYINITQSRDWLPDPIGGILWWGNHTLNTSVVIPFYVGVNELPKSQTLGNHWEFTRDSAFWAFNFVNSWAQLCWMGIYPDIRKLMDDLESEIVSTLPAIEEKAYWIYQHETRYKYKWGKSHKHKCKKKEYIKTSEYLTSFCIDNAEYVLSSWWDLADYLVCNFDQARYPRYNADGVRIRPSQEWLDAVFP